MFQNFNIIETKLFNDLETVYCGFNATENTEIIVYIY